MEGQDMTDYNELVKALRCKRDDCEGCDLAFLDNDEGWMCQYAAKDDDAAGAIEALQAEVKRLKDSNDELREAQTYIDHYGDKWMTSAKDVPTAAYEHGYADGRAEAEAQLPKRGEIVRCRECRYRITAHGISDGWVLCSKPYTEKGNAMHRADWFCADGEREVQE